MYMRVLCMYANTGLHVHVISQEPNFKSRFICVLIQMQI